jgi:hypothetical protein
MPGQLGIGITAARRPKLALDAHGGEPGRSDVLVEPDASAQDARRQLTVRESGKVGCCQPRQQQPGR